MATKDIHGQGFSWANSKTFGDLRFRRDSKHVSLCLTWGGTGRGVAFPPPPGLAKRVVVRDCSSHCFFLEGGSGEEGFHHHA